MNAVNAGRSITDEIFDADGGFRAAYLRRCAKERRRKLIRSWRPRLRLTIHVALFPKTQRRLAAMELELTRTRSRINWVEKDLQKRIAALEGPE